MAKGGEKDPLKGLDDFLATATDSGTGIGCFTCNRAPQGAKDACAKYAEMAQKGTLRTSLKAFHRWLMENYPDYTVGYDAMRNHIFGCLKLEK